MISIKRFYDELSTVSTEFSTLVKREKIMDFQMTAGEDGTPCEKRTGENTTCRNLHNTAIWGGGAEQKFEWLP